MAPRFLFSEERVGIICFENEILSLLAGDHSKIQLLFAMRSHLNKLTRKDLESQSCVVRWVGWSSGMK